MINMLDPEEAVLTGTVEGGAVQLHEDKNIGTASHGCAVSSFVVTPFGNNFIPCRVAGIDLRGWPHHLR